MIKQLSTDVKNTIADQVTNAGNVTLVTGVAGGGINAWVNQYYSTMMLVIAALGLTASIIGQILKYRLLKQKINGGES